MATILVSIDSIVWEVSGVPHLVIAMVNLKLLHLALVSY